MGEDKALVTNNGEKRDTVFLVGDEHTPQVGMLFNSYEEVVDFYKRYALRVGFGVAVRKSSFTTDGLCRRLVLVCTKGGKGRANECYQSRPTAKTNCQATLIVKLWGDGLLHVVEANLEHNHQVNPSAARFLRCYKKMSSGATKDLVLRGGPESSQFSEKECVDFVEGERLKLGEGDDEAMHNFFGQMQAKQPNFFYLMNMDLEGHLRNVFWADARSREAYRYFNDVVYFDTTYLKKKFDVPLAYFVGVNHHGQLVLLGCGLLSNRSSENFIWLFKAWLTCMLGCPPNAIITDKCRNIQCAVSDVFPEVRHRICLQHVMGSIQEKLRGFAECEAINMEMENVVFNSFKVEEFEDKWAELNNAYDGLEGNDWFDTLYATRQLWAPVFLKDTFWGGLTGSQCNESMDVFFDESLCLNTSLKEFFSKYELTLDNKYEMEAQADFDTIHKSRSSVSKFPMEERLSQLYTLNIFNKFQDELKATMYCHVSLVNVSGPISTFMIKESAFIYKNGNVENRGHEVLYNADEFELQCTCGSFESRGILCKHALSVFKLQQLYEIPSQYIVGRWRKDFKRLHALAHPPNDGLVNNAMERYDYLSFRCLHLAEFGLMSDEKYQLALKLISEVEKSLLDDNIFQDLKRRLSPLETRSNENDENHMASQLGIFGSNKNRSNMPPRRRGRPPKKRKESEIETMLTSNKEKDFVGTPLVACQSDVVHAASAVSHLGAHVRTQGGLDIMEEVSPTELSYGAPFGLNVNHHHHHIGNEPGLQSTSTLQNQFGQQAVGNQSRVQWIYQQMLQENQSHFSRRTR